MPIEGQVLQPSWLHAERRREVVNRYFERLNRSDRDALRGRLDSLESADDFTEFLEGAGSRIWGMFLKDVAGVEAGRDFAPLGEDELGVLELALQRAFDADSSTPQPFQQQQGDKPRTFTLRAVHREKWPYIARLAVAIMLLIGGFWLIYNTYERIPKLTQEFQEVRNQVLGEALQEDLDTIQNVLESESFLDLGIQVTDLSLAFSRVQKSLDEVSLLTQQVRETQAIARPAADALTSSQEQLRTAIADVRTQLAAIDPSTFTETNESSDGTPETDSTGAQEPRTLIQAIDKIQSSLGNAVAVDTLVTQLEEARASLNQYESEAAGLVSSWKEAWDGQRPSEGRERLSHDEAAALAAMWDWSSNPPARVPDNAVSPPLRQLESLLQEVVEGRPLLSIDAELLAGVRGLSQQFAALAEAFGRADRAVEVIDASRVDLGARIDQLENNGDLASISQTVEQVINPIRISSDVISRTRNAYQETAGALQKLNAATSSVESITELQSSMAARGSAPAVLLLFAIGGMFVTFGLTALLRWLKDIDHTRSVKQWKSETHLYSQIAVALLARGIDPTRILQRLQAVPRTGETKADGPIKTPVSETLSELVQVLRQKGV